MMALVCQRINDAKRKVDKEREAEQARAQDLQRIADKLEPKPKDLVQEGRYLIRYTLPLMISRVLVSASCLPIFFFHASPAKVQSCSTIRITALARSGLTSSSTTASCSPTSAR
jgi:hypothetical protein